MISLNTIRENNSIYTKWLAWKLLRNMGIPEVQMKKLDSVYMEFTAATAKAGNGKYVGEALCTFAEDLIDGGEVVIAMTLTAAQDDPSVFIPTMVVNFSIHFEKEEMLNKILTAVMRYSPELSGEPFEGTVMRYDFKYLF